MAQASMELDEAVATPPCACTEVRRACAVAATDYTSIDPSASMDGTRTGEVLGGTEGLEHNGGSQAEARHDTPTCSASTSPQEDPAASVQHHGYCLGSQSVASFCMSHNLSFTELLEAVEAYSASHCASPHGPPMSSPHHSSNTKDVSPPKVAAPLRICYIVLRYSLRIAFLVIGLLLLSGALAICLPDEYNKAVEVLAVACHEHARRPLDWGVNPSSCDWIRVALQPETALRSWLVAWIGEKGGCCECAPSTTLSQSIASYLW